MQRTFGLIALMLTAGCGNSNRSGVVFHFIGGFNRKFVVERMSFTGDAPLDIDSGIGRGARDSFALLLPAAEPTVYFIRFQGKISKLPFVYGSGTMDVFFNYTNGQYHFTNSPASEEWRQFQTGQQAIARRQRLLDGRPADYVLPRVDSLLRESYTRNFNFSDTVTDPALFLLAFQQVDYGSDYKGLERFITRAGKRFPNHTGIQSLVNKTLDYTRAFGSPLQLGDTLPYVALPDTNGHPVVIGSIPGKYTLIDFWSTWCERCLLFSAAENKVRHQLDTGRLAIISVALDAKKNAWRSLVQSRHYSWPQLIDEQMWGGPVARTLRFDSIPFNFLLGKDGRILAKGILPDSLLQTLKKFNQ
jgi:thiol-disulfide isomerase/thioredoxin